MNKLRERTMRPLAWLALVTSIIAIAVAVVWLGATNDLDGDPLIENPGAILVALVGALGLVLSVVLPQIIAVKRQVQNSHTTNLRDDIDGKHDDTKADLRKLISQVGAVQRDIAWIMRRQAEQDDRIDLIESTQPTKKE